MITSSGTDSSVALALASANVSSGNTAPKSDSSASFQDVLQEEGGDSPNLPTPGRQAPAMVPAGKAAPPTPVVVTPIVVGETPDPTAVGADTVLVDSASLSENTSFISGSLFGGNVSFISGTSFGSNDLPISDTSPISPAPLTSSPPFIGNAPLANGTPLIRTALPANNAPLASGTPFISTAPLTTNSPLASGPPLTNTAPSSNNAPLSGAAPRVIAPPVGKNTPLGGSAPRTSGALPVGTVSIASPASTVPENTNTPVIGAAPLVSNPPPDGNAPPISIAPQSNKAPVGDAAPQVGATALDNRDSLANIAAPVGSTPATATTPRKNTQATAASTSAKNSFPAFGAGTGLSAMMVQAAAQYSNTKPSPLAQAPANPTEPIPAKPAATASPAPKSASTSVPPMVGKIDLSTLIASVPSVAANVSQLPAAKASPAPQAPSPARGASDPSPAATSASTATLPISGAPDLSAMIVQASIAASTASQTLTPSMPSASSSASSVSVVTAAMMLGKEIPLPGLNPSGTVIPAKEKKSATTSAEGTFLQSGTGASTPAASAFSPLSFTLAGMNQPPVEEQLTSNPAPKNLSLDSLANSASAIAGTANVEKEKAMNTTTNFPEIFAGTNTVPQQTPVDMHIQLSTNNDFEDALKQVMHVAQLTQTSQSLTPMRVEMEIQTPPGAIVNVYVSRQNDQWRAQLSTNDPQALAWVQDKMSSLRQSNDLGVEVRWLPPQMESISTSSSSNQPGPGWDRGGQQQQGYQQQNEQQQQPGRQKRAEVFAGVGAGQFMEALTAIGSAA